MLLRALTHTYTTRENATNQVKKITQDFLVYGQKGFYKSLVVYSVKQWWLSK